MKKVLLGTTGLIAAGAIAGSAMAQEISLGRTMDLRISGETDFEVEYAESDVAATARPEGREVFFNQDQEIRFVFTGVGDATGIRYRANLEMDLSSGSNVNWDEAWTEISGGFGQFRFGNEDSATDILKIGGFSNNAGTGGLDGAQLTARAIRPADSGEATKIVYFTPLVAGFQGGVSYAVNGGDQGMNYGTVDNTQDHIEAGANWQGAVGGADLGVYAGVTTFGASQAIGGDRAVNFAVGGEVGFAGISLALGYIDNDDDAGTIDNTIQAGIGGEFGGLGVSFAYDHTTGQNGGEDSDYYVLSADQPILPGVILRGDLAYLDGDNEDGVNGVLQLRVAY